MAEKAAEAKARASSKRQRAADAESALAPTGGKKGKKGGKCAVVEKGNFTFPAASD